MKLPRHFTFSLSNIFLMTFLAALMSLAVSVSVEQQSCGVTALTIILGTPTALGALAAGVRGMRIGFFTGVGIIGAMLLVALGIICIIGLLVLVLQLLTPVQ